MLQFKYKGTIEKIQNYVDGGVVIEIKATSIEITTLKELFPLISTQNFNVKIINKDTSFPVIAFVGQLQKIIKRKGSRVDDDRIIVTRWGVDADEFDENLFEVEGEIMVDAQVVKNSLTNPVKNRYSKLWALVDARAKQRGVDRKKVEEEVKKYYDIESFTQLGWEDLTKVTGTLKKLINEHGN